MDFGPLLYCHSSHLYTTDQASVVGGL
jgi:hypothetical protein